MEPGSKKYTALATKDGLYQYKCMAMGLRNSAATFQKLINTTFHGINYDICYAYIDGVIVFSKSIPEHIERLKLTFDRLEVQNL